MESEKAVANALKEVMVPELSKIKDDVNSVKAVLEVTNKRLDDINNQLIDQSRRIDEVRAELTHRQDEMNREINETNHRISRLYEVIVSKDEHKNLEQKVLQLERDVQELKVKLAV
jgi:predicted  nucleic acid-binding Zn-ribbon protein